MQKHILITGSTDGIGKLAAIRLAKDGHQIYLHGRNPQKLDKVIEEVKNEPEEGEYISNIFYRNKSNNSIRLILNLKPFNESYINKIHFKLIF